MDIIQILIVEDEEILRHGIVNLIDWKEIGCCIAADFPDGEQALSWLDSHNADLLITDIQMPGINGLELVRLAKKRLPKLHTILLTAYASFEYAQTAIDLGVSSYIVKTKFYTELPIAVARIITNEKQNCLSAGNASGQNQKLKAIVFSAIMDQSLRDPRDISYWLTYYRIPCDCYCVLCAEFEFPEQSRNRSRKSRQQILENLFHLAFQSLPAIHIWLLNNTLLTIVSSHDKKYSDKILQELLLSCNQILSVTAGYMPFSVNLGISDFHFSMADFPEACSQAQSALSALFGSNQFALYKAPGSVSGQKPMHDPEYWRSALTDLLRSDASQEEVQRCVTGLLLEYQTAFPDFHRLKIDFLLLCTNFFRYLYAGNAEQSELIHLENLCYQDIMKASTLQQIFSLMLSLLDQIRELHLVLYHSQRQISLSIDAIIAANYTDSLKLEDFASSLNMNMSYLSRIYKKETGVSIITALNQYRIRQAKNLLKNSDLLISEIGCQVGIEDPAYFTTVFTKYEGISPQKYRETSRL